MGPNGTGKSSLIRTLAGLQKSISGQVLYKNGKTAVDPTQIAVVLTDKVTAGNMTAYELITFGRYPYMGWRAKASAADKIVLDQAIERIQIQNILDHKLHQLSDGQLQMVMIARSLAQDTPVILLDEPTAHLDLNNRVEIMKLLRNLSHQMGKGILVATHELDLALQTADVIWLTGNEKNILTGLPEDLVLDGSFDAIFQFKGFDLKTGKIQHEAHRDKALYLSGEGANYLWTKNALERSGFEIKSGNVSALHDEIHVTVEIEESKPRWILTKNNRLYKLASIAALIEHI
jgi:iron complex transport system ATP-binding protein